MQVISGKFFRKWSIGKWHIPSANFQRSVHVLLCIHFLNSNGWVDLMQFWRPLEHWVSLLRNEEAIFFEEVVRGTILLKSQAATWISSLNHASRYEDFKLNEGERSIAVNERLIWQPTWGSQYHQCGVTVEILVFIEQLTRQLLCVVLTSSVVTSNLHETTL